jgi:hypothetical protein
MCQRQVGCVLQLEWGTFEVGKHQAAVAKFYHHHNVTVGMFAAVDVRRMQMWCLWSKLAHLPLLLLLLLLSFSLRTACRVITVGVRHCVTDRYSVNDLSVVLPVFDNQPRRSFERLLRKLLQVDSMPWAT